MPAPKKIGAAYRILCRLRTGPKRRSELAELEHVSIVTVNRVQARLREAGCPLRPLLWDDGWRLVLTENLTRRQCAAWAASLALPADAAEALLS